jgi:ATP-dependent Clp protease ATP-binding subunit ClpA
MTSNAGSDKKEGALGFAKNENQLTKERAMKALSDFLRPEFLSRIDEIVVFNNLALEDHIAIARLILEEYVAALLEKEISFEYDYDSVRWFATRSLGGKSGARDLRNLIRKEVEDKITAAQVESSEDLKHISLKTEGDSLILGR